MSECAGLSGSGSPISQHASGSASDVPEPTRKRRKWRSPDLLTAEVVNPMGTPAMLLMPLEGLWASGSKGDKDGKCFTGYADDDPHSRGIAIARTAGCLLASIAEFSKPAHEAVLKPEIWQRLSVELPIAKKHLEILHSGRMAPGAYSQSEIENAAAWMYEWLENPSDP